MADKYCVCVKERERVLEKKNIKINITPGVIVYFFLNSFLVLFENSCVNFIELSDRIIFVVFQVCHSDIFFT